MKHFLNIKQECFQKKLVRLDKKKHKINPVETISRIIGDLKPKTSTGVDNIK